MDNKQQLLELFDSDEIKSLLSELIEAAETISKEEPTIGFHHKFYVPGLIGAIQEIFVVGKIGKFEKQPFYKEKNYVDFANWMIDSSRQLANLQIEAQEKEGNKDDEKNNLQCNAIILVLQAVAEAWYNRAPEVASIINKEYTETTQISLAGIVYHHFELYLEPLGYPQHSETEPKYEGPSFSDMGNQFLAIICNLILLGIIFWIGSLIFG